MFNCEGFVESELPSLGFKRGSPDYDYARKIHKVLRKFIESKDVRCISCEESDPGVALRHYGHIGRAAEMYKRECDMKVMRRGLRIYVIKKRSQQEAGDE